MKLIETKAKYLRHVSRPAILTLLLTMSFALTANARPGEGAKRGGRGKGGPGHGLCRMLKAPELALNDDQQAQIQPLCEAMRERAKPLFEEIGRLREEVHAEMKKDTVDMDLIGALHQQIAALRTEMAGAHVELRQQLREILDDSQLATLKELRKQRGAKRGLRGRRGGPGCGGEGCDSAEKPGGSRPSRGADSW